MAARRQAKAAMAPNMLRWLLAAAWPLAPNVSPAAAASACGDLLSGLAPGPLSCVFLGCRYRPEAQTRPRVARYRVTGRHARAAQRAPSAERSPNRLTAGRW